MWMDVKSFDENGFTIEVNGNIPEDSQLIYVAFKKTTWWEYVKYLFRKIFLNEKPEKLER